MTLRALQFFETLRRYTPRLSMVTLADAANTSTGIYTVSEVARYLDVRPNTLRHWFFPTDERKILLKGEIQKSKEEGAWLTFNDFLQAYAVKMLKNAGVPPPQVREAIRETQQIHGLPYPMSMRGHTIFADSSGTVHILPRGAKHPVQMTGKNRGQKSFQEVVQQYLTRMEFDARGMAERFIVWQYRRGQGRVVMDPKANFGEPTVEGTPYRAVTLSDAVEAEGSVSAVAKIYDVSEDSVLLALEAMREAPELKRAA
jgi:uncharacterized protein (DUF433 family)/transposase-like protein